MVRRRSRALAVCGTGPAERPAGPGLPGHSKAIKRPATIGKAVRIVSPGVHCSVVARRTRDVARDVPDRRRLRPATPRAGSSTRCACPGSAEAIGQAHHGACATRFRRLRATICTADGAPKSDTPGPGRLKALVGDREPATRLSRRGTTSQGAEVHFPIWELPAEPLSSTASGWRSVPAFTSAFTARAHADTNWPWFG